MKNHRPISTGAPESTASTTWREAPEGWSAALWLVTAAVAASLVTWGDTAALLPGATAFVLFLRRFAAARRLLSARAKLVGRPLAFVRRSTFVKQHAQNARAGLVWFGWGFDWTPEEAQKIYELTKIDVDRLIPSRWTRLLAGLPLAPGLPAGAIGWSALHGVGEKDIPLTVSEKTLEGGTLIVGTTQAGKGILMNVLVTQAILKGDAVLVIDPKNSRRLKDAVFAAAKLAGRHEPYVLDPAQSAAGIRLNPLSAYGRPSELAGRITAVITEEGPFKAFAWSAVHSAAALLDHLHEAPTLAALKAAVQTGLAEPLSRAVREEAGAALYDAWEAKARERIDSPRDVLLLILEQRDEAGFTHPVIDASAAVFRHDPAHYAKITASLMPVFDMLTSGPLLAALSPNAAPAGDLRPAANLKNLVDNRAILYVALDALPDPVLAGAVGAMLLADLASLSGRRYREEAAPSRIALFVDECANVAGDPLIELLNKGAESGVRTTCAMQTVSDLAARLGSDAAARMALGNFNNLIALRTKDRVTQNFVAETFGKTYIASTESALSSSSRTGPACAFSAGVSRRLTNERCEIIPTDLLGRLPNGEFFASLAGGRLVKGRIPVLLDDSN